MLMLVSLTMGKHNYIWCLELRGMKSHSFVYVMSEPESLMYWLAKGYSKFIGEWLIEATIITTLILDSCDKQAKISSYQSRIVLT